MRILGTTVLSLIFGACAGRAYLPGEPGSASSDISGSEVRYQWFVGGERQPFKDGAGQLVCELIYVDGSLREIRFCGMETG